MKNSFLTNYSQETFLEHIRENLRTCKSFCFSVSFIKKAGLVLLIRDIEAALQRGCEGKLITSTYQNFTDIESLRTFLKFSSNYNNFECHLDYESLQDKSNYTTLGFHSKGYLFVFEDYCEMIVGSSNITRYALLKNIEWDLVIQDELNSELYQTIQNEFEILWKQTPQLDASLIQKYTGQLAYAIERWDMDYDVFESKIKPNYMQKNALKELTRFRTMGQSRALVVCSAGSGKTYLSAFDALNFNPKKLLYIVHESSILKKAMETYQSVFGNDIKFGLFNGESKDIDADFLFATNVSMSKNLELFNKDEFDYIVIDECHHAVNETYIKIIEYFNPEFLLGLTATPERMDNQDVFSLFDENVPYELRLRDSIINGLVVPFHYYGVRDQFIDYSLKEERKMIDQIADPKHIEFVHKEIEKYKKANEKLKALIFCRNITHARRMAEALSEYYHTTYLTGSNSMGERIRAYDDLQDDEKRLEVICSVDILNEGVDIPGVNLVVFLRPTESSTVFIQQLGRGLRKCEGKDYVTVLDFIGNSYKRSTQIALALGGLAENLVLEKKLMVQLVNDDFEAIGLKDYGVSIHFDDLSKEEVIDHLENENFDSIKYLAQDYENFKKYIGSESYPKHTDYLNNDCAPNLMRFMTTRINNVKTGCYYNFLKGIDEKDLPVFTQEQVDFLKYATNLLPLVRSYEYDVIQMLLDGPLTNKEILSGLSRCDEKTFEHVIKFMLKDKAIIIDENGEYLLNTKIDGEFEEHIKDLLEYGLTNYEITYFDCKEQFVFWNNYGIDHVQRKLLKDPKSNQKGTYIYGKQVVIFASLKKDASIEERKNYKDKYLSPNLFQWESMNGVSEKEAQALKDSDFAYVFVRKVKTEHGITMPYIYVGKGKLTNPRYQQGNKSYLFDIVMEKELPDYLQYDFGLSEAL